MGGYRCGFIYGAVGTVALPKQAGKKYGVFYMINLAEMPTVDDTLRHKRLSYNRLFL